ERPRYPAGDKRDDLASSHSAPLRQAVGYASTFRATGPRIAHSAGRAALRNFGPSNDRSGSDPVIRQCRLDVRFARKRKWLGDYEPYVHVRYLTCAQPGAAVPQPPSLDARRRTL